MCQKSDDCKQHDKGAGGRYFNCLFVCCKPGEGDKVVAEASPVKWGSPHQARVVRRGCVDAWLHLETFCYAPASASASVTQYQHQYFKSTSNRSRIPLWPPLQAYINPETPPGLRSFTFCPFARALCTPSRSSRKQEAQIGTSVLLLASAFISALAQLAYCLVAQGFLALCLCGKMYSQILTLLQLLSEDNVCQIYLCKRSTHRRIHRSTHTGHIFSPTGALYVIVPNYESSAGHFFFFFNFNRTQVCLYANM